MLCWKEKLVCVCFIACSFVPVVPHITDAIQDWVMRQAKVPVDDDDVEPQVCVIEVRQQLLDASFDSMHV